MEQQNKIVMKTEIFNFLPLISNLVKIGLSFFITKHISNHIIEYNQMKIFRFLFGFYSSISLKMSSISFEYSVKAFESLKYFKPVFSLLVISN